MALDVIHPSKGPGFQPLAAALSKIGNVAATIVAAATTDIATGTGQYRFVSGNTTITSLGNSGVPGEVVHLMFTGTPLLTHSANLILPTSANVQVRQFDTATFVCDSVGTWRCLAYARRSGSPVNIVGTVSQDAGVPTGAIIERGSNANGEYVKFADGTMICSAQTASNNSQTSVGGVFCSSSVSMWNYPAAFTGTPVVHGVPEDISRWANCRSISSSQASIRHYSHTSTTTSVTTNLVAIGRWF